VWRHFSPRVGYVWGGKAGQLLQVPRGLDTSVIFCCRLLCLRRNEAAGKAKSWLSFVPAAAPRPRLRGPVRPLAWLWARLLWRRTWLWAVCGAEGKRASWPSRLTSLRFRLLGSPALPGAFSCRAAFFLGRLVFVSVIQPRPRLARRVGDLPPEPGRVGRGAEGSARRRFSRQHETETGVFRAADCNVVCCVIPLDVFLLEQII